MKQSGSEKKNGSLCGGARVGKREEKKANKKNKKIAFKRYWQVRRPRPPPSKKKVAIFFQLFVLEKKNLKSCI